MRFIFWKLEIKGVLELRRWKFVFKVVVCFRMYFFYSGLVFVGEIKFCCFFLLWVFFGNIGRVMLWVFLVGCVLCRKYF